MTKNTVKDNREPNHSYDTLKSDQKKAEQFGMKLLELGAKDIAIILGLAASFFVKDMADLNYVELEVALRIMIVLIAARFTHVSLAYLATNRLVDELDEALIQVRLRRTPKISDQTRENLSKIVHYLNTHEDRLERKGVVNDDNYFEQISGSLVSQLIRSTMHSNNNLEDTQK